MSILANAGTDIAGSLRSLFQSVGGETEANGNEPRTDWKQSAALAAWMSRNSSWLYRGKHATFRSMDDSISNMNNMIARV